MNEDIIKKAQQKAKEEPEYADVLNGICHLLEMGFSLDDLIKFLEMENRNDAICFIVGRFAEIKKGAKSC